MRRSKFSEEQMVKILREADRAPVAEVAKRHKISEQTIYVWRRKFGTLEAMDAKRLKGLESENARLKKLLTERDLEIAAENDERVPASSAGPQRREGRPVVSTCERACRCRVL